jgi:hypothetical protein
MAVTLQGRSITWVVTFGLVFLRCFFHQSAAALFGFGSVSRQRLTETLPQPAALLLRGHFIRQPFLFGPAQMIQVLFVRD